MVTFRSRENGEAYPIDGNESATQEAIDRIMKERSNACDFCGTGNLGNLLDLPDRKRICSNCFEVNLETIIDRYPEFAALAEEVALQEASSQEAQPSLVDDTNKCGRCGKMIPNYGKGGSREHWLQYHANELV